MSRVPPSVQSKLDERLIKAMVDCDATAFEAALDQGASVTQCYQGGSLIHSVLLYQKFADQIAFKKKALPLLLAHGAAPTQHDLPVKGDLRSFGAIIRAIAWGDVESVACLIEHGARLLPEECHSVPLWDALLRADEHGERGLRIVQMLIDAGSPLDLDRPSLEGKTLADHLRFKPYALSVFKAHMERLILSQVTQQQSLDYQKMEFLYAKVPHFTEELPEEVFEEEWEWEPHEEDGMTDVGVSEIPTPTVGHSAQNKINTESVGVSVVKAKPRL